MVVQRALSEAEVDRMFRALADATRRNIVRRTLAGETTVSELAEPYNMSFAAVQKHVAVLERAGFVIKHRKGRERIVCGNRDMIRRAQALLNTLKRVGRASCDERKPQVRFRPRSVLAGTRERIPGSRLGMRWTLARVGKSLGVATAVDFETAWDRISALHFPAHTHLVLDHSRTTREATHPLIDHLLRAGGRLARARRVPRKDPWVLAVIATPD